MGDENCVVGVPSVLFGEGGAGQEVAEGEEFLFDVLKVC